MRAKGLGKPPLAPREKVSGSDGRVEAAARVPQGHLPGRLGFVIGVVRAAMVTNCGDQQICPRTPPRAELGQAPEYRLADSAEGLRHMPRRVTKLGAAVGLKADVQFAQVVQGCQDA